MRIANVLNLIVVGYLIMLTQFLNTPSANAWIGRMDNQASSVIGQVDFDSISENQGGTARAFTLRRPRGVFEMDGKLAVTDWMNNRILIYNSIPTTNNASADLAIGQQTLNAAGVNQGSGTAGANTLNQPGGISGGNGKFVIADTANHRVLIFNGLPTENNASAALVLGQLAFNTRSANQGGAPSASTMNFPEDVWSDGNKVIVADRANNRILIWNTMPTENGEAADVIVGQPNASSVEPNQGGAADANTINAPNGVSSDGTKLFVADSSNSRILIYNNLPSADNASANVVVGQENFSSTGVNQDLDHPEAYTIGSDPQRVYSEGIRLYVCDKGNQRILIYNTVPTENNASADAVFGQVDFVTAGANAGASGVSSPRGIFAGANNFYVTDRTNNRVMVFKLAPENISISINNGASETTSGTVDLSLGATGAYQMMISNSPDFTTSIQTQSLKAATAPTWEQFSSTKQWALPDGAGDKTIYVKFRDFALFESDAVSATITYDPPAEPSPSTTSTTALSSDASTLSTLTSLPETGASGR